MDMLNELIEYNHAANLRVIDVFKNAGKRVPEAERLFSHILNAQFIWICRIKGIDPKRDTFQLQDPENFTSMQNDNTADLLDILKEANLSKAFQYQTTRGDTFTNTINDVLYHLINHSTYHRGQIAMLFRQNGVQPPVTDYIMYKRDGKL